MKQSKLFFKTRKETPSDADSINASYLIRAGFVDKHMSGVYALLPLGMRVFKKIEKIVREEMDNIGGQEILMNVLQPKELWNETGRWEEMDDVFYKMVDSRGKELGLGPTHEEQVTDIARKQVKSYKDLPFSIYQIQTKFRNEPRAKSGLLRGREFIMKDMYSFHTTEEDLYAYYDRVKEAYFKMYERMGLLAKVVEASGGVFSKFSHEFQVLAPSGEDTIFYCDKCDFAENKEIAQVKEGDKCPKCDGIIECGSGIEVGNIFPLGIKYSKAMKATFLDKDGQEKEMVMGCYGFGLTRCLATVVEVHYNIQNNRMNWPKEIAPFAVHLISLNKNEEAEKIYNDLKTAGIEALYDDRDISVGTKFAEADLIGLPVRIIVSEKSLNAGGVELQKEGNQEIITIESVIQRINE